MATTPGTKTQNKKKTKAPPAKKKKTTTSRTKKATKSATKNPAKKSIPEKKVAAPSAPPAPATVKEPEARPDRGTPIDNFFARQPEAVKPITDALRELIDEAAPDAQWRIKWGMPFFDVAGTTIVAIGAHRAHVNLILPGPAGTFADPKGLLEDEGTTGQHLKIRSLDGLPRTEIGGWLKAAAARARKGR